MGATLLDKYVEQYPREVQHRYAAMLGLFKHLDGVQQLDIAGMLMEQTGKAVEFALNFKGVNAGELTPKLHLHTQALELVRQEDCKFAAEFGDYTPSLALECLRCAIFRQELTAYFSSIPWHWPLTPKQVNAFRK